MSLPELEEIMEGISKNNEDKSTKKGNANDLLDYLVQNGGSL